jgi:hypothetical protein
MKLNLQHKEILDAVQSSRHEMHMKDIATHTDTGEGMRSID